MRRGLLAALALAALMALDGCAAPEPVQTTPATEAAVYLGDRALEPTVRELTVTDPDLEELTRVLTGLPSLEKLTLEGQLPPARELLAFRERFPALDVRCRLDLAGVEIWTDQTAVDLTGSAVTAAELAELLPLLDDLRELTVLDTPLTDREKMDLADRLPGVLVRCELPLAGGRYRTDETFIDLSGAAVTVEEVEGMLPYFPRLEKLDLSFCGIDDETMDQLNRRHPGTNIVWTVTIGEVKVRTDAVYFYPAESNYYPTNEEMKKLRYCPDMIAVDIGHTRASDCEWLRYMPHVRYLILADTNIRDITPVGTLKELVYLELFSLDISDYSPLLNCTALQDLNIGTTHADPEPLSKMTWLHNLQWHRADQDPATREAVLRLVEQLPDTNVVLYPRKKARNIGGPWRYLPHYYVFRDIIGADYFNQDQIYDYWGQEDGARIMACEGDGVFVGETLAQIVLERMESGQEIVGVKNIGSEKAWELYDSLAQAQPYVAGVLLEGA